jgi:hypothetical protein
MIPVKSGLFLGGGILLLLKGGYRLYKAIFLILFSIIFVQELEVDGDLKLQGNLVFSDSTQLSTAPMTTLNFNGIKLFNMSQEWVVPNNINSIFVRVIGGGGGGTSGASPAFGACFTDGAGGGSGGYAMGVISVMPNEILTINFGNGGSAPLTCENAENGGDSYIKRGEDEVLVIAYGGYGGTANSDYSWGGSGGTFSIENGIGKNGNSGAGHISGGSGGTGYNDGYFSGGAGGKGRVGYYDGEDGQDGLIIIQW